MNKTVGFFCMAALMNTLCTGFVACNEPKEQGAGLGKEIPEMETYQATGTVIGSYSNGVISILVQVDEKYPVGKPFEYFESMPCANLPAEGTYKNMIQVQYCPPPVGIGSKISFSVRAYDNEKDIELFQRGAGNTMCAAPSVPVYVITEYEILNN